MTVGGDLFRQGFGNLMQAAEYEVGEQASDGYQQGKLGVGKRP